MACLPPANEDDRCTPRVAAAKDRSGAPCPIAHCACGRLTGVTGQPPEAWLGIGFRDRSGSPPRGCGRRGGYLALGEVRIEWRLSFQQHTSEAKQAVGNTSEGAAVRFAAPA